MKSRYPTHQKSKAQTETARTEKNTITSNEKLLTSEEVAIILGKSEAWLARKRWEGNGIPYRKIGRHVRYQLSVVLEWLNRQPEMSSTSAKR